jgi:hypothetical protein
MPRRKPHVYLFNWPSGLDGADTKAEHLLRLLKDAFEWTVVPNAAERLRERKAVQWLKSLGGAAAACLGNEMMWHHTAELGAISAGLLDVLTLVSPVQAERLVAGYATAMGLQSIR